MPRIHLDQIGVHAPLTKQVESRPAWKRYGQNRIRGVYGYQVLHELVQEQNVAVQHFNVFEPVPKPGPAAKIVDAEDLGLEAELASQPGHVNRRRAKESADFDDGFGLHFLDKVFENGAVWAPPFEPLGTEEGADVDRREVIERWRGVVDTVEDRLSDEFGGERVGTVSADSEVVELRRQVCEVLDSRRGRSWSRGCLEWRGILIRWGIRGW